MKNLVAIGLLALSSTQAWAWGSYGHQQINRGAVELIASSKSGDPAAQCLSKNRDFIQRLGIAPDYDWKKLGSWLDENYNIVPRVQSEDKSQPPQKFPKDPRFYSDSFEHPLHYFEIDAFADAQNISVLPKGDYASATQTLIKLRKEHAANVVKYDPEKAKDGEVTIDTVRAHGSAPWRIRQLYQMGVAALKKGETEKALIYLGSMGHYVGDMSQPFHATLNYDGKYDENGKYSPFTAGIHSAFETEILKFKGNFPDKATQMYSDFSPSDAQVQKSGSAQLSLNKIEDSQIVEEVYKLIASGTEKIPSLLTAMSDARKGLTKKDKGSKKKLAAEPERKSASSEHGNTVQDFAFQRMGDAAALQARLLYSAFQEAAVKELKCDKYSFDRKLVGQSYPIPDYLPEDHRRNFKNNPSQAKQQPQSESTEESTPFNPVMNGVAQIRKFGETPLR